MDQNNQNNDKKEEQKVEAEVETKAATEDSKKEEDFKEKFYYLAAEMDNYRKRMEREKENLLKYGSEKILSDLLDVMDNFDRTITMLEADTDQKMKNVVFGLDMVRKQFLETLSKHGLTQLNSIGQMFDPNFHEAMAQEYAEGKKPNEIVKEFQKGYTLNGRLIRAAKVIVASDKQ